MSIKHSLLALLVDGPRSASQLQQRFSDATEGVWPLNIGQVTQTLARLERDGLIVVDGQITGANGHITDTWRLTDDGHELLARWWDTPVQRPRAERNELVIKVALAAQCRSDRLIPLLDDQRRFVIAELRELTRASRGMAVSRTADRLHLERRIFELEAEARWLDRVESLTQPDTSDSSDSPDASDASAKDA